jgi:hypothetical protein
LAASGVENVFTNSGARPYIQSVDLYEELGLRKSASVTEVRRAYKKLALLLHPDRQPDPELRRLAELQMRRLNETVASLVNSTERMPAAEGGLSSRPPVIVVSPRQPVGPVWRRASGPQSFAFFFAGAAFASIFWYATIDRTPAMPMVAAPAPVMGSESSELPQRIQELERQVAELRKAPQAAVPHAGTGLRRGFAGTWSYELKPLPGDSADFLRRVDLQITEEGSTVRGEYSSTKGTPESSVAFHFEGNSAGESARIPWTGAHGANGEIELRLLRANVLEVRWWAYGTGADTGETSSTAILRRVSLP